MRGIRSFFQSTGSTTAAAEASILVSKRKVEARSDQGTAVKKQRTDAPGKVHPFFQVKHGRRPTTTARSTGTDLIGTADEAEASNQAYRKRPILSVDSPLPTPESMFTTSTGQPIAKLSKSLDLVYWNSLFATPADAAALYSYLLHNLAWHRVKYYKDKFKQSFSTPRWTTTFGRDNGEDPDATYERRPVPVPPVLRQVQSQIEARTGERFNAIIINFYADGKDSISYHSDDESFLGPNPAIASLTLGTPRPFLLRRKENAPPAEASAEELKQKDRPSVLQAVVPASSRAIARPTYRLPLPPGSLLLMRGRTQHEWEHSISKSTAKGAASIAGYGGRMNLTFRLVKKRGGTENFIRYNRGDGPQYRWDGTKMLEAGGGL